MKPQELVVICSYSEKEDVSIAQVIQSSFEIFLKKELQSIEK